MVERALAFSQVLCVDMKIHYLVFIFLKKFSLEKGSSFQLLAVGLEPGTTRLKEGKIRTSPLTVFLNISCENFAM